MLNISENSVYDKVNPESYGSFRMLGNPYIGKRIKRIISLCMAGLLLFLFLPWTQNIQTKGKVTTLRPDQRPQEVQATIGGKIEKWYVREGQHVSKGDTLLYISEISSEYFDPNLVDRTQEQIQSKTSGIRSYESKVNSLDDQIMALNRVMKLKTESYRNKVQQAQLRITSDSMDFEASRVNYSIAEAQFNRQKELYDQGLKSLTDLEAREMKLQEALAKRTAAENKYLASKNELVNATIELSNIRNEYGEKISKAESEKFSALSDLYNTEAEVAKIQNKLSNYFIRSGFYYIVSPQDGFVTKTLQAGIGENITEGEAVLTIVPDGSQLAVEMYVEPMDYPLIHIGSKVQFLFDGWPAIVFSGWPGLTYGTFSGEVVAIDNVTSANGKYRILVSEYGQKWPEALRVGGGARGIALLNNVPIWYEMWRKLNGFPPDFYDPANFGEQKDNSDINIEE